MRLLRFLLCALSILVLVATLFSSGLSAKAAPGNAVPSDVCSLLTAAQLKKTIGKTFGAPQKSVFPAVYMGQADGTQCIYHAGSMGVRFIFYSDRSASEAKQTFNSLTGMFPAKSKPTGIGDQAYLDNDHALHVLKENYRFFISVSSSASDAATEKQEEDLATAVVAHL